MTDLLHFTKMIAQKINYYDAVIDFADETHWFNPFYKQSEVVILWSDKNEDEKYY